MHRTTLHVDPVKTFQTQRSCAEQQRRYFLQQKHSSVHLTAHISCLPSESSACKGELHAGRHWHCRRAALLCLFGWLWQRPASGPADADEFGKALFVPPLQRQVADTGQQRATQAFDQQGTCSQAANRHQTEKSARGDLPYLLAWPPPPPS